MSLVAEAIGRTGRAGRLASERREFPIAIHLTLFAIGTLLPVLLIVAWMLFDAARLRRDDSLHDATTVVRHLNATIDVEAEKAIAVAETLAASLALSEGDYTAFDRQARDVANRIGMVIVSRDLAGQQITSTAVPLGSPLPVSNEGIRAVDQLAAARKAPVVSDLVTGTVMQTPVVIADVPVFKGQHVAYFIDVVLLPQRIVEIVSQGLPDGWIAGVIGGDGRLIARNVDQDRYVGTANRSFLDVATQPEGVWSGSTRDGLMVSGAYMRSPLTGWVVSVAVPQTVLQAPVQWAMGWIGGLAVAALAVSTFLGWRLSRRIALPIRDLVTRARELGEGRRPADAHASVAEVNQVTVALRAASVELDRRAAATKQALEAVQASETLFRGMFETAAVGVAVIGLDGAYLLVNQRMCDLVGYSNDEMLTKTIRDLTDPADIEDNLAQGRSVLAGEIATFTSEKRYVRKSGEVIWCALTVSLQSDQSGAPEYFISIVRDVSVRRRAQAELQERLREIEALYDNAPVGLTVLDSDRRFLRMNQALAEMNGLPLQGNTGRFAWDVLPALREALDLKIAEVLATGQTVEVELSGENPRAPGITHFWHDKIYPIRQPGLGVTAVGIVVEEITARKRAEEHLRFLLRELSHRSKNLLAVVQAMAGQTAKSAENVADFRRRFGERLMGLAASHDLLVNQNWLGASVEELVRGQLSPFVDGQDPRLRIGGPAVDLKAEAAEALGLALHELATNSIKYGALNDQAGKVEINWIVYVPGDVAVTDDGAASDASARPGERRFRMDWIEYAIAPVSPPSHKGFGRIVIEHTVETTLRGTVTLDFPPEGMRWCIDAPASCLAPSRSGSLSNA
jgi:PAS domain S-box-containing protein